MQQIDQKLLRQLEKLSCLNISIEEENDIANALEKTLGMFEKLSQIDTGSVDHLSIQPQTSIDGHNIRQDEAEEANFTDVLKEICPEFNSETMNIVVPQVIEK